MNATPIVKTVPTLVTTVVNVPTFAEVQLTLTPYEAYLLYRMMGSMDGKEAHALTMKYWNTAVSNYGFDEKPTSNRPYQLVSRIYEVIGFALKSGQKAEKDKLLNS